MIKMAARVAAGAVLILAPLRASAAAPERAADLPRTLIQGCLADPSAAAVAKLAAAVGATPYPQAQINSVLAQRGSTTLPDVRTPGTADRTETEMIAYRGWALPGPGGGGLAYREQRIRKVTIEQATNEPLDDLRVSLSRACIVETRASSGRAVFEAYEALHGGDYGALITADRKDIIIFRFSPDAYDIELDISLDSPLAGTRPGVDRNGPSRLVLLDGGPRFISSVPPGVPTVTLTRAALLAGLDRPATIDFGNTALEAVPAPPASPPAPRPAASP